MVVARQVELAPAASEWMRELAPERLTQAEPAVGADA